MNKPDRWIHIKGVWLALQDDNRLVGHLDMNVKAPSKPSETRKSLDHLDMEEAI